VIDRHGLFCEPYTDRGHYFRMPKAGEAVSKTPQTQVGRADAARHPPHRGLFARGARPFRARLPPLQDRLPKELALAGITTVAAANRWLAESDCPAHNVAFAVTPARPAAPLHDRTGRVREILCIQEDRRMGYDNTVKWRGLTLQIPPSPLRAHCARRSARARTPDGRLAIFHGPHRLVDYHTVGNPSDDAKLAA